MCSTCGGLAELVFVQLSWLSGRTLAAQARGAGFNSRQLLALFSAQTCLFPADVE